MSLKINTYILKSFDNDQNEFIQTTFNYLSSVQEITNNIKIADSLKIKLSQDDFLIIVIDELSLEQITQNASNKEFFLKKDFQNNQVVLILDDLSLHSLPEYLQYFQTFSLVNNENVSENEEGSQNQSNKNKSNLFEIINDIVHYIKRVKLGIQKDALTVYIGPSDDNTTLQYQKITRELLHRDYNIVPQVSNATAKELIENQEYFTNILKSADLSIHFIGHKSLMDYPEKTSSALKINEITANYCNTSEGELLQRIIYVPTEKEDSNELLSQKILQFKSDTKSLFNAEMIQTPVEKFKEVVLQKLRELSMPLSVKTQTDDIVDDIYLIYAPGQEKNISVYTEWFKKNNISYSKSQIELDQLELLNYHQKKLTTCKGVVIFNNGNNEWLSRKLSDIKKSPGWGRKKPFKVKAIFGINPESILKSNDNSFIIIDDNKKLNSAIFKELLLD